MMNHWCTRVVLSAVLLLLVCVSCFSAEDPFRLEELLKLPLDVKILKERVENGIQIIECEFTSEIYKGKPVRIFGIYAVRAEAKEKLPGVIWTQGGLYKATEWFPVVFAKRGYGCLCIDAPFTNYRSTPVAGYDVWHIADPISDHSAVRIARALHRGITFLTSRPEIDAERIGAAGSSWGGYSSFLVGGLDERVKVISTFFGCGNLHLGSAWESDLGKLNAEKRERWRRLYDPAARLPGRKGLAVMITTGTNDHFYSVPAVSKTYLDGPADKRLAWIPHYNHGLNERGDEIVMEFVDHHLRPGVGTPFNEVTDAKSFARNGKLVVGFGSRGKREVLSAEVWFSPGPMGHWEGRLWVKSKAGLRDGIYEAEIPVIRPDLPLAWYASLTDTTGAFTGTDVRTVTPGKLGVTKPTARKLETAEGCIFGGFEPEEMTYLRRLAQKVAPVDTSDPHSGKQSLKLEAKDKDLIFSTDYLRWCPAFAARLTAWVRGTGGTVKLAIGGTVDGNKVNFSSPLETGRNWADVTVNMPAFKPGSRGILHFSVTVPAGGTIWLDDVSFVPVTDLAG